MSKFHFSLNVTFVKLAVVSTIAAAFGLFVLIPAGRASASTGYYIDSTSGNDSNPGTQSQPWQTISQVNTGPAGGYQPGDTINFKGGETFSDTTLSPSLVGASGNPIIIQSYGTGQATISVPSQCSSPATVHTIWLTNPAYVTIQNLKITAVNAWSGSGTAVTVCNGGYGIYILSNTTSGTKHSGITIQNDTITGTYRGIQIDGGKTTSASTDGFNQVTIQGNSLSNVLAMALVVQGYGTVAGGGQTQNSNVIVTGNTFSNIPGDPKSGSGGVHGSVKTESEAINIGNVTGSTITYNTIRHVAGFGGAISGLTFGGSSAISVANSANSVIEYNLIGWTGTSGSFDGSALDCDQFVTGCEIAYNLSYENVGPAVQFGSFDSTGHCGSSCITTGIKVHDNISWNDVRGYNFSGGLMEQGVYRDWGDTDHTEVYNNTIYADQISAVGLPSCLNFEVDNGIASTNFYWANNICKTTKGMAMVRANQTNNPTHLPSSFTSVGNVYDSSGSSLLISNATSTGYTNITSLNAWQALGYEKYSGTNYGTTGSSYLTNLNLITSSYLDSLTSQTMQASLKAFGLGPASSAIGSGIDPTLLGLTDSAADFLGNTRPRSGQYDVGAIQFLTSPSGTGTGKATLRGRTVVK